MEIRVRTINVFGFRHCISYVCRTTPSRSSHRLEQRHESRQSLPAGLPSDSARHKVYKSYQVAK